ncbi:MAG: PIN domain-containing protein [Acidobacteria bacterium]|nr:PIN domain-containing protein [Acidobacteriota bacterium]
MIVLDANVLISAYDAQAEHHVSAKQLIEGTFSSSEPVAIPLQSVLAFLRIMTNTHLPGLRFTAQEAIEIVEEWWQQPQVRLLHAGEDHWHRLRTAMWEGSCRAGLTTDAHIAAITMECGGTLYSYDRDFSRFPGLRWRVPSEEGA